MHDTPNCPVCGGTVLPSSASGALRGSCRCPRGPGQVVARMYYSTDSAPARREYDVEWQGVIVPVEPPTQQRAEEVLADMRAFHRASYAAGPHYDMAMLVRQAIRERTAHYVLAPYALPPYAVAELIPADAASRPTIFITQDLAETLAQHWQRDGQGRFAGYRTFRDIIKAAGGPDIPDTDNGGGR